MSVAGEFPSQRPVTRSFDVFFNLCPNKGCINIREAGDLRRHRAHYDVSVMGYRFFKLSLLWLVGQPFTTTATAGVTSGYVFVPACLSAC